MRYHGLKDFLGRAAAVLAKGPVAMIFVEDFVEAESTLRHHLKAGFRTVLAFAPTELVLEAELEAKIHRIDFNAGAEGSAIQAINGLMDAASGSWIYYCFNSEYLFHPFAEHRSIGEMLTFHTEERRDAVLTYVIDLYAGDLTRHPNAVSLDEAYLDRSGYYALGRPDPLRKGEMMERQLDFYGGLRWRFEEHVPESKRRIDRISLFRARQGLRLLPDQRFNDEEYNTYACPWHHNITVAIVSFRMAKALKTNAGSRFDVSNFRWHNSARFNWHSQQLLDLGLMEPGQWF